MEFCWCLEYWIDPLCRRKALRLCPFAHMMLCPIVETQHLASLRTVRWQNPPENKKGGKPNGLRPLLEYPYGLFVHSELLVTVLDEVHDLLSGCDTCVGVGLSGLRTHLLRR